MSTDAPVAHILSGAELRAFVDRHGTDVRTMSFADFRTWLEARVEAAARAELFRQRCLIRDLKWAHRRRILDREKRLAEAQRLYDASPEARAYDHSAGTVASLEKAVAGLTAAVEQGRADPDKLAEFRTRLARALAERDERAKTLREKKRLDRATQSLARLRAEIGLEQAEAKLEAIGRQAGHSSSNAGERFERLSSRATTDLIVPSLARPAERLVVLHGVTLGCARGELDQIVVDPTCTPAEVLAVVEAKRNINDLAHGYQVRQENLAFFAGADAGFDPQLYRTDRYPQGRFTSPATHTEEGRDYTFETRSFAVFAEPTVDTHRLRGLYFVTESRPLLGVGTGEMGRILHRVATDPGFNLQSTVRMRRFFAWVREMVDPFQSRDVFALYAEHDIEGIIFKR